MYFNVSSHIEVKQSSCKNTCLTICCICSATGLECQVFHFQCLLLATTAICLYGLLALVIDKLLAVYMGCWALPLVTVTVFSYLFVTLTICLQSYFVLTTFQEIKEALINATERKRRRQGLGGGQSSSSTLANTQTT